MDAGILDGLEVFSKALFWELKFASYCIGSLCRGEMDKWHCVAKPNAFSGLL